MSGECERDTGVSTECEREEESWFISGPARPGSGESLPVKREGRREACPERGECERGGGGATVRKGGREEARERESNFWKEREREKERGGGEGGAGSSPGPPPKRAPSGSTDNS